MSDAWHEAVEAASLFAGDPAGLGGIVVRSPPGPVRDRWLAVLGEELQRSGRTLRKLPIGISDAQLLGSIDVPATLQAGRPIARPGLLADMDDGVLLLPMAERAPAALAARLGTLLDLGRISIERDGLAGSVVCRVGIVALDESLAGEAGVPAGLTDRLALSVDLSALSPRVAEACAGPRQDRSLRPSPLRAPGASPPPPRIGREALEALCAAATAFGIVSLRAPMHAARVAERLAARRGQVHVSDEDVGLAARWVFAERVRSLPEAEAAGGEPSPRAPEPPTDEPTGDHAANKPGGGPPTSPTRSGSAPEEPSLPGAMLEGGVGDGEPSPTRAQPASADRPEDSDLASRVVAAARAALPPGLLDRLEARAVRPSGASARGARGDVERSLRSGRPCGSRPGTPGDHGRLDAMETLRAAAPWQRLRGRRAGAPLILRREDLRLVVCERARTTTTIFAVDTSGSAAGHRLAEVKGAIELLLAESYVRRDRVALIAFRGARAELLLPPTRSLARVQRTVTALPGGGGTPLAAALDLAADVAAGVSRAGSTPILVLLTDGAANVARDGTGGRDRGRRDALDAARRWSATVAASGVYIDAATAAREDPRTLATLLQMRYVRLPLADARGMHQVVRAVDTVRA